MLPGFSISTVTELSRTFAWNQPSWDLFIFGAWAMGSVLYAFTAGRGRIINILMSVYIAKLLVYEAPFLSSVITKNLPSSLFSLQQLATFVLMFLILFMFLGRYAFRTSVDGRQAGALVFGLIFSVLQIGLLINTILGFLPSVTQTAFHPLIHFIFLDRPASFIWLVLPLAFLILLGRHIADPNEI